MGPLGYPYSQHIFPIKWGAKELLGVSQPSIRPEGRFLFSSVIGDLVIMRIVIIVAITMMIILIVTIVMIDDKQLIIDDN